jgi:fermentation-respiration switch protein FrsA (DUF1100 family)
MAKIRSAFLTLFLLSISVTAYCQSVDSVVFKNALVLKLGRSGDNRVISPDGVVASIITGNWKAPEDNELVKSNDKIIGTWKSITSDDNGWFRNDSLVNAYLYLQYKSDKDQIVLLEAMGNTVAYVNGSAHSGNLYRYQDSFSPWEPRFDYSLIPVKLHKGVNEFVVDCRRGYLKVKLQTNRTGLIFDAMDLTAPDIILNQPSDTHGAIAVINATENYYGNIQIKTWTEGAEPVYRNVNPVYSLSIFKTAFDIKIPAIQNTGKVKLNIQFVTKENDKEEVLSSSSIDINVLTANDTHKETFISKIDGSVQYYAVNPPENLKEKPALFLSLHGAGVEAINQATSYYHKNWGYIVCPTNRRPYGYNWENWGRIDALEVYDIAKKEFNIDENRIYLTGHSMGGHGTWQLGINYPDKFAAIGPSAGWISIWSYRIHGLSDSSDVRKMLVRSTKPSDTYAFTTNLKPDGVYIIQGSADDNVPPDQAESMVANLSKFHKDFIYYVQPGAGHWWDVSDEPGADCVDWMPMFDFFAHHAVPSMDRVKMIDFVTANPAVSSKNNWIEIINQTEQQKLSKINIVLQSGKREFVGTTSNIQVLAIDASVLSNDSPVSVSLDNQLISGIKIPADGKILLQNENGQWKVIDKINPENKNPVRCGNLREAFNNNVLFVYGSHGNKEENKWALDKAKLDAEKIWYQGNSSIEIIKDDNFDLQKYKDRSVILFGNSKTNSAWDLLLKDSPVQINSGEIKAGDKEFKGKDLACLMIRPRPDSKTASVGVISGTGIKGMNLVNLAPYFDQYVNLPDIVIFNSGILQSDESGVKFTGYFGNDWSLEKGEFVNN